ncbi:MAG: hypothetical protein N4A63_09500 [Vallitalea sp.]|jgi:outer membrane murein-binding lipoprotein Lpp|nr:hypothetical protein [Vallitalea sp.]
MKKITVFFLTTLLLVGCKGNSNQVNKVNDDKILSLESEIQEMKIQIDKLEKEKNKLEIKEKELISKEVYSKGYYELENMDIPRAMYVKKDHSIIRNHPYEEAIKLQQIHKQYVIVHTLVTNENNEKWALIENPDVSYSGHNNYGYINFNQLEEREYTKYRRSSMESIGDIEVGDLVEEAILLFGRKHSTYKTELGLGYDFDGGHIGIDPISYTINSIAVNSPGYKTKEGVQVGDNEADVIKLYKEKYKMNENQALYEEHSETIFQLDDGYVIEFKSENGIISSISIYDIYQNW